MIIVMNKNVTEAQIGNVVKKAQDLGHEINLQDAVINMCGIPGRRQSDPDHRPQFLTLSHASSSRDA